MNIAKTTAHLHKFLLAPALLVLGATGCSSGDEATAVNTPAVQAPTVAAAPSDKDIVDAWTYLYGRYLVIQQENHDINVEKAGYNKIKYNPIGSAQFVNPNLDVAYLEAWIATDKDHAVILNVPEVTDRYYTAQLLDGWGEVITNINERTYPDHPFGKFALVIKGSDAAIPEDAVRIELPAGKTKLLARVELKVTPDRAVALQKQFTLDVPDGIVIDPPFPVPEFTPVRPIDAKIFDDVAGALATYPDAMPSAGEMQAKATAVSAYLATGPDAQARVDDVVIKQAVPGFLTTAQGFGTQKGGWSVSYVAGKFGDDMFARDTINYGGLWANDISEALYFVGLTDGDKQLLDGGKSYEIRFAKGDMPDTQVNAFWSVTLYSVPDYRVVENSLKRYNFNNLSALKPNDDGSTSLWLGSVKPAHAFDSNWLPTPDGKGFALTMRMYVSKPAVLEGEWFPPTIQRLP